MASAKTYYHAILPVTKELTSESLAVNVDDAPYTLYSNGDGTYGGGTNPPPSNPVGIYRENGTNYMVLKGYSFSSGNHSIVIQEDTSSIETTECFKKAVQSVSLMRLVYNSGTKTVEGATFSEALKALESGAMLFLNYVGTPMPFVASTGTVINFEQTRVRSDGVTAVRAQWGYDGTVTISTVTYPSQG